MSAVQVTAEQCNICQTSVRRDRDLRWRKDGYDIVKCPSCGTFFRIDLPAPEMLREIYGTAYFADTSGSTRGQGYVNYLGDEPNHRANAAARLNLIERYQPAGRLLDVGCAAGFFLDEATQRGWTVEGIELSPEMAEYARSRLALNVHAAGFAELELPPSTFDAITMWDYLEHSIDPMADVERATGLLRPGGLLAISTGDADSTAARLSGQRWHLLTPRHHNFFFTRTSLDYALRRAGLQVVATRYLSSLYSVHYLVHKLRTMTDFSAVSAVAKRVGGSRFGRLAVPVNFFDIVTVIARRDPSNSD